MYISIDLGGTSTRVASSTNLDDIHKIEKFYTDKDLDNQKKLIADAIAKVSEGAEIDCISLGVPGILSRTERKFFKVPNYPILNDLPFNDLLPPRLKDVKLLAANDAALAGFGEAVKGSGKDYNRTAYLTLSTGVGGTLIVNKDVSNLYHSYEPGHQIIVKDGRLNPGCGQKGCLEAYASGTSFKAIYNVHPYDCVDSKIWTEYTMYLALGIVNLIALWAPDVIVFGGSVSNNKFDVFEPLLSQHIAEEHTFFDVPLLKPAKFKDDAGIYGGFAFIQKVTATTLN